MGTAVASALQWCLALQWGRARQRHSAPRACGGVVVVMDTDADGSARVAGPRIATALPVSCNTGARDRAVKAREQRRKGMVDVTAGTPVGVLAVHAHPDDESSKGAGTLARLSDEGVRTIVVTCTGGEEGDILNPAMERPEVRADLPAVRRAELARALEILGVDRHYWLGYRDSGMAGKESNQHADAFAVAPLEEATARLVAILRHERPEVVITYDETGGYPHPDHIRTHEVTVAAFEASGDPSRFPEAGPAFSPRKLYYHASLSRRQLLALHQIAVDRGIPSPFAEWLERREANGHRDTQPTTQVDVGPWMGRMRAALLAHATQIDPQGPWLALPEDAVRAAYPWDDYVLAQSAIEVSLPETDLLQGLSVPRAGCGQQAGTQAS